MSPDTPIDREAAKLIVNPLSGVLDSVDGTLMPVAFEGCLEACRSMAEVDLETLNSSFLELNNGVCIDIVDLDMTELALAKTVVGVGAITLLDEEDAESTRAEAVTVADLEGLKLLPLISAVAGVLVIILADLTILPELRSAPFPGDKEVSLIELLDKAPVGLTPYTDASFRAPE